MLKECSHCLKEFSTNDSRRKSCSKFCANKNRSKNAWTQQRAQLAAVTQHLGKQSLPAPEDLPAPYAKQVHDMWVALMGNAPKRIA